MKKLDRRKYPFLLFLIVLLLTPQEVTSVSKVDQAIDQNAATGKLDATTLGEYFKGSTDFSLFTVGTESTVDFSSNEKQLKGTTVHEITHGLLTYKLPAFIAKMDYWLNNRTPSGIVGAEAPITNYGKINASEDFSEAVMYYFTEPATLKTSCPIRHQFIKDAIKNWK